MVGKEHFLFEKSKIIQEKLAKIINDLKSNIDFLEEQIRLSQDYLRKLEKLVLIADENNRTTAAASVLNSKTVRLMNDGNSMLLREALSLVEKIFDKTKSREVKAILNQLRIALNVSIKGKGEHMSKRFFGKTKGETKSEIATALIQDGVEYAVHKAFEDFGFRPTVIDSIETMKQIKGEDAKFNKEKKIVEININDDNAFDSQDSLISAIRSQFDTKLTDLEVEPVIEDGFNIVTVAVTGTFPFSENKEAQQVFIDIPVRTEVKYFVENNRAAFRSDIE